MKNYIPVSKARAKIGDLVDQVKDQGPIYLTKGGEVAAAIVDANYLKKLEDEVKKLFDKTYIKPELLPYTREFTEEEIAEWLELDKL